MAGQIKNRYVTLNSIMRSRAFRDGVTDYLDGFPPREQYECARVDVQWNYERGRLFAAACPSITPGDVKPVKGMVPYQVQLAFNDTFNSGAMI